jgi:hypothetical protein
MSPEDEIVKLRAMLALMVDQRSALIAAGEKMEAALVQARSTPMCLREWQAVMHQIKKGK